MVESTRLTSKNLIVGEYVNTTVKPRAGDRDILLLTACQPIDAVFPDWIQRSKLQITEYQPFDVNFPSKIPRREFFKAAYHVDAPLSNFGAHLSMVTGRQMVDFNFHPQKIFTGPSLKCLQTAAGVASHCRSKPQINIEPGIWGEYDKIDPSFLISSEIAEKQAGIPVNRNYQPLIPVNIVDKCSNWSEWRKRCVKTFKSILEKEHGHVVFILDPLAMKALSSHCIYGSEDFRFKSEEDFLNISSIPFGSCLTFERADQEKFTLPENFFPSYTSLEFSTRFDFDQLDEQIITQ